MKITVVLTIALAVLAGAACADLSNGATATVYCKVDPNVSVRTLTSYVNAGTIQTGDFSADVWFRVDANMEAVALFAEASALYKGGDPTEPTVAPIPVDLSKGVAFAPTDAAPYVGYSSVADFMSDGYGMGEIEGFPTISTGYIPFESSQDGHFSQDVKCTFAWTQPDPEKPEGEYQGRVGFTAIVVPYGP